MAHSLEVRVPFLDHTFVSSAASLPTRSKLRNGTGKHILKEALKPLLPHEVLYRSKMGFAVPLDSWFRDSIKARISDVVGSEQFLSCGIFDPGAARQVLDEHLSSKRDHSALLWATLMFDGFLRSQ